MASKRLREYGTRVVPGDLVLGGVHGGISKVEQDSLSKYQLRDVVLPIPGYSVEYPTNNVGKFYEDFLSKENVQFDKDAFEAAATKGAYRQLIAVPTNFDCKVQVYENSIDAEFQFDLDKGSYATMLLRELMLTTICRRVNGS